MRDKRDKGTVCVCMEVSKINMKKNNFKAHRRSLKKILIPVVIQVIIILLFYKLINISKAVEIEDTTQMTVTVDAIRYEYNARIESRVWIKSNSQQYFFGSPHTSNDYAAHEIFESLSEGDEITIIFYEENSISGPRNRIIDARTDTEVFCTYENYLKSMTNVIPAVCALFSFVELLFLSGVFFFTFPFDWYSKRKKEKEKSNKKSL